jgi:hypothetical protein
VNGGRPLSLHEESDPMGGSKAREVGNGGHHGWGALGLSSRSLAAVKHLWHR